MKEIEAKFYVTDLAGVAERLEALGADLAHPRTLEENWRYDTPDHKMDAAHQLLRLRKSHQVTLTYKSASVDVDGTSQRTEHETQVDDIEQARAILAALGFVVTNRYQKFRTEYTLAGMTITLDELPIGDFVEIEGHFVSDIQGCAADLGLEWDACITENYLLLFNRYKRENAIGNAQLTFDEMEGVLVTAESMGVRQAD
jgi:predicted adenylyl cyclase CyaB